MEGKSKFTILKLLAVSSLVFLASCAPSLGNGNLRISPIINENDFINSIHAVTEFRSNKFTTEGRFQFQIVDFDDNRGNQVVGEIDGRPLKSIESIPSAVRQGLERRLVMAGGAVGGFNAPLISGEIISWFVKVTPGFPTTEVDAIAKVRVMVVDNSGVIVTQLESEGDSHLKKAFVTRQDVEKTLAAAMANTLDEVVKDRTFMDYFER